MQRSHTRPLLTTIVISILFHLVVVAALWFVSEDRAAERYARLLEQLSQQNYEIVFLTQPTNNIRPDRTSRIGKADNSTTQETVARVRKQGGEQSGEQSAKQSQEDKPAAATGTMAGARRKKAPATAIVQHYSGGTFGQAVPEDYLPNIRHGGHTYVNIHRYPGIAYFVEVKQSVTTAWNPRPIVRRHIREIRGRSVLRTVLGITIDETGDLAEAFVLKTSGIADYDREALRAFRATFPFFLPPRQVLALDGKADDRLHLNVPFDMYM